MSGVVKNPRTELVGVCDIDADRARKAGSEYDATWYTDLDELLTVEDVEWLHVCTPVQTHLELATKAIQAGIPVLIEKPVTETLDELEELAASAERHDVRVTAVHNQLYMPAVREARERIHAGEIDEVLGIDLVFAGMTRPDDPNRGSWTFDLPGGEFEEGLPHSIYLTLELGGFPADASGISATTTLRGEYEQDFTYDEVGFQYVTEAGTICSGTMRPDPVPQRSITVHGGDTSLLLDSISHTVVTLDREYDTSAIARALKSFDHSTDRIRGVARNSVLFAKSMLRDDWGLKKATNSHYYLFDEEVSAIKRGSKGRDNLERARWAMQILESIRESAGGRVETVPETTP
jgi:predicted dehydrogenase